MKRKGNTRGMTLVELLVSMVILVLVITLASSMLLAAYRFFNKSAEMNLNKLSSDGVYQLVSEELKYATEIKVLDTAHPEYETGDWHWITVDTEDHLLMDGKGPFDDVYYHGQKLELAAYADGDARLYLNVTLVNPAKEKSYQTGSAFETINIQQARQFTEYPASRKAIAHPDGSGNSEAAMLHTPNLVIYYYALTDRVYTGTVLDYLYRRSPEHTKEFAEDAAYQSGDFVWYQGSWYYLAKPDAAGVYNPGRSPTQWIRVQTEFDGNSGYLKNDVVSYQGNYYRCKQSIFMTPPVGADFSGEYWQLVVKDEEASTATRIVWKDA